MVKRARGPGISKCESRQIFLLFAMESRERSLQREAEAAIAALKHATIIRSTKADWQLVAAAQATRRGDYSDEFAAAAAMGKPITQRREIECRLQIGWIAHHSSAAVEARVGGGTAAGCAVAGAAVACPIAGWAAYDRRPAGITGYRGIPSRAPQRGSRCES